ncbi:MAG TPA: Type 1 glutamine amidotransferase-like domain-containing protein [Myxococcales bacterium]
MQGSILFNGNVVSEADFITRFKDRILSSNHEVPAIRASKKVLMVTAAWKKDEYNEGHIRAALNGIGVVSHYENGYDANIQNLSVYHDFNQWRAKEPDLHRQYHAKQEVIKQIKQFYRRKNSQLVSLLKEQNALIRQAFPETSLGKVLRYPVQAMRKDLSTLDPRQMQFHYWCQDVQETMKSIVANDAKMVDICNELDLSFQAASGVMLNPLYRELKKKLEERILSANSIFIFGGFVAVLYNRLNFFKLKGALVEALRRGTNFYTVSAGTGVLCNSIILYNDYGDDRHVASDFEFFDNGFGLVTKVQVFPHCMDRIKTDDADNLAYLAHRFQASNCVGMNQESYLLMETYLDRGEMRERATSVGEKDAVYLFDRLGRKTLKRSGEQIPLEG